MADQTGPVLAVIDCATGDHEVIAEAAWLARAAHTGVVLVHVARPASSTPWGGHADSTRRVGNQIGLERRALSHMHELAASAQPADVEMVIEDVYFGDPASEVAYAASKCRATAVVAARRQDTWFAWRSRDSRLARQLRVPLVLTNTSIPSRLPAARFDLLPNEGLASEPSAPVAASAQPTRRAA